MAIRANYQAPQSRKATKIIPPICRLGQHRQFDNFRNRSRSAFGFGKVEYFSGFFSLADEQHEVGVIEKGNTQIIAEKTGADLFSITSTTVYPTIYDKLLDISAPPELAEPVTNMTDYDTVFIGYPMWWGNLPTIVKVFLENHNFSGKTVIPFCTHAGSGLSETKKALRTCARARK